MRIHLASIFVDDQAKALEFYTEVLGFECKEDYPVGDYRWLTLVSPGGPDGTLWSMMGSRSRRSGSTTSTRNMNGSPSLECASRRSQPTSGQP